MTPESFGAPAASAAHPLRTPGRDRQFRFAFLREDDPGDAWAARFHESWPFYRDWFLSQGDDARPSRDETGAALRDHMPELLPLWRRLCALVGDGDLEARFLGLWNPPAFLSGCSQAAVDGPRPFLVRNYDYEPDLFEGVFLHTSWTGTPVMAMADCAWGALDGVNGRGLAVSLSFGGRRAVGEGFGIPLVLRYLLETCGTAAEGIAALRRIPVHMAYNVSLLDGGGNSATAALCPGEDPDLLPEGFATNHQRAVHWPKHAVATRTVERHRALGALLEVEIGEDAVRDAFLEAPLFSTSYGRGWGTLYTAVHRPGEGSTSLHWRGGGWHASLDDFPEGEMMVRFRDA